MERQQRMDGINESVLAAPDLSLRGINSFPQSSQQRLLLPPVTETSPSGPDELQQRGRRKRPTSILRGRVSLLALLLSVAKLGSSSGTTSTTAYQPQPLLFRSSSSSSSGAVREQLSDELLQQQRQLKSKGALWTMDASVPSMLLASSFPTKLRVISSVPSSPTTTEVKGLTNPTSYSLLRRNRGVLGFQILDHHHHTTTDNYAVEDDVQAHQRRPTRLQLSSRSGDRPLSNVDSSSWNLPESLSLEAGGAHGSSSSSTRGNRLAFAVPGLQTTTTTTTDIPWVPNREEIEALTVVQLKEELGVRALKKNGLKAELQERLKEWTIDQECRQRLLARDSAHSGDLTSLNLHQAYGAAASSDAPPTPTFENELLSWGIESSSFLVEKKKLEQQPEQRLEANSLAEWGRTVDLQPLLQRREAIHREKLEGKPKKKVHADPFISPSDYLAVLKNVFDKPSSPYSNYEVKQMYFAAKHADQVGNREVSKRILLELKKATPNDARVYRRLSRMEKEDGNVSAARAVLNEGLELQPENAFLWHGLGQLEGSVGDEISQKKHWHKAIEVDPSLPHSYHALGTLEHTQGRVANAMNILKKGIEYCPTNHRLHHALGDLYRDAKMLSMAKSSYQKALKHGPYVSHGFVFTALAYTAYEEGQVDQCRRWLHKAVRLNNGRHANGWVALAQLEESEGNIDAARSACIAGIGQYERGLLERSSNIKFRKKKAVEHEMALLEDPVALKNKFLKTVPTYRSGDRFFNVYRNWVRLEERYGTIESVEEVYERASVAFPREWKLALDAAQYYVKLDIHGRARDQFAEACTRSASHHADPYRLFAEFEMSLGNYAEARKIMYSGAITLSQASASASGDRSGLAELFLSWAVCEWHLGNLFPSGKLFDHALELTMSVAEASKLRSFIQYSMARFEYFRGEYRLAQHFIGLCLKENLMPGGNSVVWDLWAVIAHEMGDGKLAHQCQEHAMQARLQEEDIDGDPSGLSRMLNSPSTSSSGLSRMKGPAMQHLMRRDPWHRKIFGSSSSNKFLSSALLPDKPRTDNRR